MPPRASKEDARLHAYASTGVAIVIAGMFLGGWASNRAAGANADGYDLEDMEVIEASIAYRSPTPQQKQPQKKKRAPDPETKPEGVSHDETKAPDPKPDDKPATKPGETDPDWQKFKRNNTDDDDLDVGKAVDDPGPYDPNATPGWANEDKGDPYFQKLVGQLREGWEYPEILNGAGVPVVCFHLERDGTISDTLFKEKSGNDALDDSVERALKLFEKTRKDEPPAVPDHLLKYTSRPICVRLTL